MSNNGFRIMTGTFNGVIFQLSGDPLRGYPGRPGYVCRVPALTHPSNLNHGPTGGNPYKEDDP